MTHRQLNRLAGVADYHCDLSDPTCKREGRCTCLDRHVVESEGDGGYICGESVVACHCGFVADYLCDWPLGGKTCDAPLCEDHALPLNVDLSTLRPSDMLARRAPDLVESLRRGVATLADLHLCPAHWALSHPQEHP